MKHNSKLQPFKMLRVMLVAWLMLGASSGIAAMESLKGREAADPRVDYWRAASMLRALAERGDADAQSTMGWLYYTGSGVPRDYREAMRWYRGAASQGDARAQYAMGVMYENGQGVPQSAPEAVQWYLRASKQGHARAHYNLGVIYAKGQGVPQDSREAVRCFLKAAEQGHAGATYNLGVMYMNGHGVPRDYVEAHKWFNLALSQYASVDASHHDKAAQSRDVVATRMTDEQLREAQKRAREWKSRWASPAFSDTTLSLH